MLRISPLIARVRDPCVLKRPIRMRSNGLSGFGIWVPNRWRGERFEGEMKIKDESYGGFDAVPGDGKSRFSSFGLGIEKMCGKGAFSTDLPSFCFDWKEIWGKRRRFGGREG